MKNNFSLPTNGNVSAATLLAGDSELTLIDRLLRDQSSLTAVGRFSRKHENHELPAQQRYYRDLIPLTKPGPGEQYAFSVDLDTCTGCKACVSACHSLNGLDDEETWRDVGWLHNPEEEEPYQQTVTTACHHCADPACLNGCPVKAYDKDPETGIVRHLDDQCIGCQYCVLKCPYEVPKYSKKRGIVRKCDMCYNRLAVGEAPACVQACPSGAIKITKVVVKDVIAGAADQGRLLPGAFDSSYTKPTTVYHSVRGIPERAEAGDRKKLRLEHAHFPLIVMLLLTQAAVGLYLVCALLAFTAPGVYASSAGWISLVAFGLLQAGLGASIFHLGRPLGAWRAFLGWKTSWMSREILVFGAFAGAAGAATGAANFPLILKMSPPQLLPFLNPVEEMLHPFAWSSLLMLGTAAMGLAGVFCSAMIYIDTRRAFWKPSLSLGKFFGNTFWLGTALTAGVTAWTLYLGEYAGTSAIQSLSWVAAGLGIVFLVWETMTWKCALGDREGELHVSARIMGERLRGLLIFRGLAMLGAGILMLSGPVLGGLPGIVGISVGIALAGLAQGVERYFYFVAVKAPRMPGAMS